jgi:hypothetical protein
MKNSVKLLPLLPLFLTSGCQSSLSDSQAQVFESLVQTERAFANTSISSGTRAALLELFAADGGIAHGPVAVSENGIVDRAGGSEGMSPAHVSDDVAAARAALSALDEEYSRSVAEDGFAASIGGILDRSRGRLLASGSYLPHISTHPRLISTMMAPFLQGKLHA